MTNSRVSRRKRKRKNRHIDLRAFGARVVDGRVLLQLDGPVSRVYYAADVGAARTALRRIAVAVELAAGVSAEDLRAAYTRAAGGSLPVDVAAILDEPTAISRF